MANHTMTPALPPIGHHSEGQPPRLVAAIAILGLAACAANQTVAVGGACSGDTSCATGVCFAAADGSKATGWTAGYCSGNCEHSSCPQGKCQALADGKSYCLATCAKDSDCRSGYVCDKNISACLPDCRAGWSCGSALVCSQDTGACTPPSKTIRVGGACSFDVTCTSGTCFQPTDTSNRSTGWTDGYCSGECGNSSCPDGKCQALADGKSYCLATCVGNSDCRSGYICAQGISVCLPDCRNGWSCGNTLTCNQNTGNCE
jgi:hypothetical protein